MLRFERWRRKPPRITTGADDSRPASVVDTHSGACDRTNDDALAHLQELLENAISRAGSETQVAVTHQINELQELVRDALDKHGTALVDRLQSEADELRRRLVDEAVGLFVQQTADRLERLTQRVTDDVGTAARRALLTPVVTQLIALHDRILAERAFLTADYHRRAVTALDNDLRLLHERCEAALRSFVTEVLVNLAALGVQRLETTSGPLDPRHQRVRGVEPTTRSELNGQIARIVRVGFTWDGAVHRPEDVIVYQLEKAS